MYVDTYSNDVNIFYYDFNLKIFCVHLFKFKNNKNKKNYWIPAVKLKIKRVFFFDSTLKIRVEKQIKCVS